MLSYNYFSRRFSLDLIKETIISTWNEQKSTAIENVVKILNTQSINKNK